MIAKSLIYKGAMPKIEIDPETYSVTADGELLVCEPAEMLPISQRYFFSTREASHSRAMSRSRNLPASPMGHDHDSQKIADRADPVSGGNCIWFRHLLC